MRTSEGRVANHAWVEEFPGAVTVCDREGRILEMNRRAVEAFAADGGAALLGRNLLACHPEPARTKLAELLAGRRANVYTIERRGVRKLIYQSPWYDGGEYRGFVELSLVLPVDMPHFVRD
jgi:PAS domain-containing protein